MSGVVLICKSWGCVRWLVMMDTRFRIFDVQQRTLSTVTCDFNSAADISCALSSGFTDSTTTWYGCKNFGLTRINFHMDRVSTPGLELYHPLATPCTSTYARRDSISSSEHNCGFFGTIVCTEYAVTITGTGFDHNTPSNNIVRLSAGTRQ